MLAANRGMAAELGTRDAENRSLATSQRPMMSGDDPRDPPSDGKTGVSRTILEVYPGLDATQDLMPASSS